MAKPYISPNTRINDRLNFGAAGLQVLGTGLENLQDQIAIDNSGNIPASTMISGSSWSDVLNNGNLNEGLQNIKNNMLNYSDMFNNENIKDISTGNDLQHEVNYTQGNPWGAMLKDAGVGASAGSVFGPVGALVGGSLGAVSGWVRSAIADKQHKQNAYLGNLAIDRANNYTINSRNNAIALNDERQIRNNMRNVFQDGGDLGNGVTIFNTGNTHQQNPLGGIPQGIASDGLPNRVEENELKYDDYIYSARLKASKKLLKDHLLPEKYEGLPFAEIGKKLQKESEDRPNDPVSRNTLETWMSRLRDAQEEYKAKLEDRRLAKVINNLSTEEKAALASSIMQQMQQPQYGMEQLGQIPQQPMQEVSQDALGMQEPSLDLSQPMYANGGKIHIKPSKRGTFTAAATKHGMGVQEFASKVLAHPENYTEAMRKKAQSARNSAHLGQEGLDLEPLVPEQDISPMFMWNSQEELKDYYRNAITDWFSKRNGYDANKLASYKLESRDEFNQFLKSLRGDYSNAKNVALAKLLESQIVPDGDLKETQEYIDWAKKNYPKNPLMWDAKIGIEHHPMWIKPEPLKGTTGQTKRYWRYNWNTGERTPITEAEYNNPATGWKQNPELNEEDSQFLDYYIDDILPVTEEKTKPTENNIEAIPDNWLRYAPLLGGLAGLFNRPDYTLANELTDVASNFQPISAPPLSGWRRYNSDDINLTNNQNMAQLAAAQRANVASGNRDAQAAGMIGLHNAYNQQVALNNLAWQQANERNRLDTDTYSLGIDKTNLATVEAYDQSNQQILDNRANLLAKAAEARDNANTFYSQNMSNMITNNLNNLGAFGKENLQWALINRAIKDGALKGNAPTIS